MNIGGRIPWNVTVTCEIFRTHCLMDKTPYGKRFGKPFERPIVPFGSLVEYHPISAKDSSRIHQFGKKVLLGIFFGYVSYAERIWKGDILVVDLDELEEMDAPEIHAERLDAKVLILPKCRENCKFRITDGTVQLYGGDQGLRTSTLIRNQSVRGESRQHSLDGSKWSPPTTYLQDSYPDASEARDDFWSILGDFIYRHHVEPRVKLYTPREESFPIPLKKLTSPESLILPWMCCSKVVSMIIGTSMDQEICPIHGQVSHKSPR